LGYTQEVAVDTQEAAVDTQGAAVDKPHMLVLVLGRR